MADEAEDLSNPRASDVGGDGAASPLPAEPWRSKFNPWLIAVVVALAAFMEVLDTSIANVALPHIAGDLSAGVDESTWVLSSYRVANAVVLPISAWLSRISVLLSRNVTSAMAILPVG